MATNKTRSTSVERAMTILEALDNSRRGLNISEISRKLAMPKSTAHVLISTLEHLGYLRRPLGTRNYTLGLKVHGLGRGLMTKMALQNISLPHLNWLVEKTKMTVHLAILENDQGMYIQKSEGLGLVRFDTYIGKRVNLHCTAIGKMLLAYAPKDTLQAFLLKPAFIRHTNKTITSVAVLRKQLRNARERGYTIDDEEEELGVRCLAVPVFDQAGQFMAALGITGTVAQIRENNIKTIAKLASRAATNIFSARKKPQGKSLPVELDPGFLDLDLSD